MFNFFLYKKGIQGNNIRIFAALIKLNWKINMKTIFKLSMACCGIMLASLFSTTTAQDNTDDEDNSTIIEKPRISGCYGDKGTCGITKNGTILVGKWVEF